MPPVSETVDEISEKPATFVALMPSVPEFCTDMNEKLGLLVLVSRMPSAVLPEIVPPEPAVPVPVTTKPPEVPVLFSRIPLFPPVDAMLANWRLPDPIVALVTFRPMPAAALIVPAALVIRIPAEPVKRPEPLTETPAPLPA